ncbi:DUF5320 family protein [Candidatus Poribacteria bacterium]|nr:DUF5320 family protein [Candidatus Poribacteria bacterium]
MKIAVTSTGPDLRSQVDPRFGRCPYILIVDSDTMQFEAIQNPNVAAAGGAGIQTAQMVADKGAQVVLTGGCGPNAYQALSAAGIQIVTGVSGVTVEEAVRGYLQGRFQPTTGPNVPSHFGVNVPPPGPGGMGPMPPGPGMGWGGGGWGRGGGFGRGGGWGRGRGGGWGAGGGFGPGGMGPMQPAGANPQAELEMLRQQAEMLRRQLEEINRRIEELEKNQ